MDVWGERMSEVKRDEIVYEEGWHESAPVIQDDAPHDASEETPVDEAPLLPDKQDKTAASPPLLLSIQLVLCLLAALVLFLLKAMDSDGYHRFMTFYHEEEQKPLIARDVFNAVDLGALFSENAVTVEATPDETAPVQD